MDIQIQTHRIKTSQPRVFLMIDGPYIDGLTEEEKERDRKVKEACDVFNKTMEEVYGAPVEDSWAGKYYWPIWMNQEGKLAYAFALTNFRSFLRQLSAEQYALYIDTEKANKEYDATKTP